MLFSQTAVAQQSASSADRVVYEAAFYSSFAPRTALDMINQTPGFVLAAEDDEERRGFAGAVGNVLIDGQRLGAKSQSLRDVLGRVGAREVLRIEVLRGNAVAGDASGASVLANVVRTPSAGGGTWEAGFEVTNEDEPTPNGKFGWSGRKEAVEFSLGGTAYTHDHLSAGWFESRDDSGELLGRKNEGFPHEHGEYALNGQVSLPAGDGKLTVTGQAAYFRHNEVYFQRAFSATDQPVGRESIPFGERTRTGEAGVTWQKPMGSWEMNLTALATRKHDRWHTSALEFDAQDALQSEAFQGVATDSGETIVRGTFARNVDSGRLEYGAEAAVNTLDGEQQLTIDSGAGPTPVTLPNANLSVEETRGEAFVSYAWHIDDVWSLDSRLAAETSRLTFTGDTEQSVSLTYLKPRVQLTRQMGKHQLQVRVYRDVGQLDFNDFVTTAAFANDVIEGGNPDLRPQTAWAVEAEGDLRFSEDSALRLRLFKHFVRDVVDFVPVGEPGEQFDAPGNIGNGGIIGAEMSLRVPLNRVLRGGSFNVSSLWQDTEVTDPLTGEDRPFSDLQENHIRAELRQDLNAARFAWGATYEASSMDADFKLNEVFRFREIHRLDIFAETTWISNLKIRLELQSALDGPERRIRRFYAPDRNGPLVRSEIGEFEPGHWWLLTVSSSF
ncbi:MAG TPA: TonB-dependent receptor [Steroidobacteraceae bacterium]|nr:TonB-dependent receptor [Steroidobacteraceae bacterium]